MDRCRDCLHFDHHPTDRRQAGHCQHHDQRQSGTAPACAAFLDPFNACVAEILDRLEAEGCTPHLLPGGTGPRLAVRLSADSLLNLRVARHHARLTALLIARCRPAPAGNSRGVETPQETLFPRARRRQ